MYIYIYMWYIMVYQKDTMTFSYISHIIPMDLRFKLEKKKAQLQAGLQEGGNQLCSL